MNTTIKAELNLSSNIFEYRGNYFRISRTVDGHRKELSDSDLENIKKRLVSVVEEAVSKGNLDINSLEAFELNSNSVFYVFNHDEFGPWNGSMADQWVKVSQTSNDIFSGIVPSSKSPPSSPVPASANQQEPLEDDFEAQKSRIEKNIRDEDGKLDAESLGTYLGLLENKYNKDDHSIRILDPVIIQNVPDFRNHPKLKSAITTFNSEPNLKTLYIPFHIGSSARNPDGHWICAALTRENLADIQTPTVVVYDSLNKGSPFVKDLEEFLGDSIQAKSAFHSINRHQKNAIDCGVHVLHFIEQMEETRFRDLIMYLNSSAQNFDIPEIRNRFADEFVSRATDVLSQSDSRNDLWTVKDYHSKMPKDRFVGVTELKKIQSAQLAELEKLYNEGNFKAIKEEAFNPWVFPILKESDTYGKMYRPTKIDLDILRNDDEFFNNYFLSAWYVLASYGWNLTVENDKYKITPYGSIDDSVRIPSERLIIMDSSFYLFNKKLSDALTELCEQQKWIPDSEEAS